MLCDACIATSGSWALPEVGLACGQDRIKEWGKRYLAPMLAWFGIEFPDRVVKVCLLPQITPIVFTLNMIDLNIV